MIKLTLRNLGISGMIAASMHFASCDTAVHASIDIANESEGGPSGSNSKSQANIGFNAGLAWTAGLSAGKGVNLADRHPHFFTEDSAWSAMPVPYEATPAGGRFEIGYGVGFVQKGAKFDGATSRENYLEGVADIQYRYSLSAGGTLYGGLGPFIGYGIGGKTGDGAGEIATFSSESLKRFDAGLNLCAGYQFSNSLSFNLGYDFGLVDRSTDPSDYTTKSRNFSISVGYSVNKIISAIKGK